MGSRVFQGLDKQHDYCNNGIYNDVVDSKLILTHQSCCCLSQDMGKCVKLHVSHDRMLEKYLICEECFFSSFITSFISEFRFKSRKILNFLNREIVFCMLHLVLQVVLLLICLTNIQYQTNINMMVDHNLIYLSNNMV